MLTFFYSQPRLMFPRSSLDNAERWLAMSDYHHNVIRSGVQIPVGLGDLVASHGQVVTGQM